MGLFAADTRSIPAGRWPGTPHGWCPGSVSEDRCGLKQRYAIARALVEGPKLLLASDLRSRTRQGRGGSTLKPCQGAAKKNLMVTHNNKVLDSSERSAVLEAEALA